jgi:hypothetical protein
MAKDWLHKLATNFVKTLRRQSTLDILIGDFKLRQLTKKLEETTQEIKAEQQRVNDELDAVFGPDISRRR